MSAFRSIASQWTVNVKDITDALKAGTVNVKEAAALMGRVKSVGVVDAEAPNVLLKDQLSAPEHVEQYHGVMKLRGLS